MVHKVVEYERPKMIPGQYVRTYDAGEARYSQAQHSYSQPVMSTTMHQGSVQPMVYQTQQGSQQPMMMASQGYVSQVQGQGQQYYQTTSATAVQSPYVPQQTADDAISA